MAINLTKGQRIDLRKASGAILTDFCVGVNWGGIETKAFFGLSKKVQEVDLDLSAALLDTNGKLCDNIYSPLYKPELLTQFVLPPGNLRAATGLPRSHLPEASRSLVSSWGDLEALTRSLAIVEHRPDSPDSELPPSMQTGIVFAIQTPTMPLGTLWLFDRSPRPVGAWELEPLRALAAQIALVLERVALLKESESHHRIQTELRVIADHLSLAPRVPLPETSGLEATFRSYSQHEVGGDLCDLISLSGDTTAIVVGDVSGNSIPAALVANAVKGALQPLLDGTDPLDTAPPAVMGRLNSALDTVGCGHQFVSLFYGI